VLGSDCRFVKGIVSSSTTEESPTEEPSEDPSREGQRGPPIIHQWWVMKCIEKWEYLVVWNFIRGHVGRLPFMPIVLVPDGPL
jgi:hypothetical protein